MAVVSERPVLFKHEQSAEYRQLIKLDAEALAGELSRQDITKFSSVTGKAADITDRNFNDPITAPCSIFHQAIDDGNITLVTALIDRKIDVNAPDGAGFSPLALALINAKAHPRDRAYTDIAIKLLKANAQIFSPIPNVLEQDNIRPSLATMRRPYFISKNAQGYVSLSQQYDWDLYTEDYSLPTANKLSERIPIADERVKNSWVFTFALSLQKDDVTKALLGNVDNEIYATILSGALKRGRFNIVTALSNDARFDGVLKSLPSNLLSIGLLKASEQNNPSLALKFLELGANPNFTVTGEYVRKSGMTALHFACQHEQRDLIEALVKRGAKKNADKCNFTPLISSLTQTNDPKYVEWLVDKGFRLIGDSEKARLRKDRSVRMNKSDFEIAIENAISYHGNQYDVAYGMQGNQSLIDTFHDIYDKLIFPVILEEIRLGAGGRLVENADQGIGALRTVHIEPIFKALTHNRRASENPDRDAEDTLLLFLRLHHTLNHPNINFPTSQFERNFAFEWLPLTKKQVTPSATDPKYSVVCLTTSQELREESNTLGHCVGKYGFDLKCSRNDPETRPHLFSIRKDGKPISTFEVVISEQAHHNTNIMLPNSQQRLQVVQHRTFGDKPATKEAQRILNQWLDDVGRGAIPVNENLGQTEENKLAYDKAINEYLKDKPYDRSFYEACTRYGLHPATLADAEAAFEDSMRDIRRASERLDKDNRLIYCDREAGNKRHVDHFIDGLHINSEGRSVSYRDMSLREWLTATGLMTEVVQANLYNAFPEIEERRSAEWENQDSVIVGAKKHERAVRLATDNRAHYTRDDSERVKREKSRFKNRISFADGQNSGIC